MNDSDKPTCDFSMDDVFDLVRPDRDIEIYTGPLVITAMEIQERHGVAASTAARWAKDAVERGEMVRVWIRRRASDSNKGLRNLQGYVPTEVYQEWKADQAAAGGEGDPGS